jgi:KRAB domain-containing zinc finger protein
MYILPFQCKECDITFAYKTDLKSHSRVHIKVRQHECKEFGEIFKTKQNIKNHEKFSN